MFKKALSVAALSSVMLAGGAFAASMTFADVPADHWAADAISWASEKGLMSGDGENFRPTDDVTRAELALVLQRFYDMQKDMKPMPPAEGHMEEMYKVMLENVSEYTISPGLVIVHTPEVSANFESLVVGEEGGAPEELVALAEAGEPGPLKELLMGMEGVKAVIMTEAMPAGEMKEVEVKGYEGMDLRVSYLGMLVESNDIFAFWEGDLMAMDKSPAKNLDAGTEMDMELGSGCEGGQPAEDCNNAGEPEDPRQAIAPTDQMPTDLVHVSIMEHMKDMKDMEDDAMMTDEMTENEEM